MTATSPTKQGKTSKKKPKPSTGTNKTASGNNEQKKALRKSTAPAQSQTRQSDDQSSEIGPNNWSVKTAYEWFQSSSNDHGYFAQYLEHIKSVNGYLASEIESKGNNKRKEEFVKWVGVNVGPVSDFDKLAVPTIVQIATVAAGLTSRTCKVKANEGNDDSGNLQRSRLNEQADGKAGGKNKKTKSKGASGSAQRESRRRDDNAGRIALSDLNAKTAYDWQRKDPTRSMKYRNYFACHDQELVGAIERRTKGLDKFQEWVCANIGFVAYFGTRSTYKSAITEIAIVAAGLTSHGVDELQNKYEDKEMDDLTNPNAHSFSVRDNSAQQKFRKEAESREAAGKDAAHFVGLDVATKLNHTLAPNQKMGQEDIKFIFNIPENFSLDTVTNNRDFHVRVDNRVIDARDKGPLKDEERARLQVIVEHVQSDTSQTAFVGVKNGPFLYDALRKSIKKFDISGKATLWDARKDKLRLKPKAVKELTRPSK